MEGDTEVILNGGLDAAHRQIEAKPTYPFRVEEPVSNVVLVCWAQSHIDNGWLGYFFEMEAPGCPPYSVISNAYRAIGASMFGDWIDAAVARFPFDNAHLFLEQRCAIMYPVEDEDYENRFVHEFFADLPLEGRLEDVWQLLAAYIKAHEKIIFQTG